jgi:NitT/TauT family transport system substrate-binding protein
MKKRVLTRRINLPIVISILMIFVLLASCTPKDNTPVAEVPIEAAPVVVAPTEAPAATEAAVVVNATEAPASKPECKTLTPTSIRLNWQPQTEHAGLFIALWKGFYKDQCLDVTINPGGPEISTSTMVASGEDDFGIAEPHVDVIAQSKNIPFVEIMQFQHDAYLRYIAKKASGITKLTDIKGKTVSLWLGGGEYEFLAMMASQGISEKDVNLIAQKAGMAPFLTGDVDVAEVTLFNELRQVYESGVKEEDLTIFSGSEYGVGLVADGLFTRQDVIDKNPGLVQAVVDATIRGWQWAYENPEETAKMFVEKYPELDYDGQLYMLNVINELNVKGKGTEKGLGYIDPQYFITAQKVMDQNKLLEGPVTLENCYNQEFWNNAPAEYKTVTKK